MSLRQLAEATGINRGVLSQVERGRLIPTADEFAKVMAALESPALPPAGDSQRSST